MILRLTGEQLIRHAALRPKEFAEAVKKHARTDHGDWLIEPEVWGKLVRVYRRRAVGLGDAVASIAQPVARAIDAVAGTKIAECGGCKKRREALNRLVPDITHPTGRPE